jgi:methylmalonyl-CoA/ethylmalonyl-CoA epimerase
MTDNPHVVGIKHMAFAVRDVAQALDRHARLLCVPAATRIVDQNKARNRVAIFTIGGIEYQLCQSMDPGGRFDAWIAARGGEGLHHVCYAVTDIARALQHAVANGARLAGCVACGGVTGAHAHSEGYVAFLEEEAAGIGIEYMQIYTEEELRQRQLATQQAAATG